jgi:lipopolysaccharide export system protein LptC
MDPRLMDQRLEARFREAARHSRFVRFLRIGVPAAVVFSMGVVIYIAIFNPFRDLVDKLPLDISGLNVSGTKITMESPHLSGYTPDRRPYDLWAKTAVQDVTNPDRVELNTLHSKVLMEDQSTVLLDARTGLFDNKQQTLDLHKDIYLETTTGYQAWLISAFVDLGKGTVDSEEHVDVKLTNGTLSSDRLHVTGGGEVVRFEGNVVMHLEHLDATKPDGTQEAASTASNEVVPATRPRAGSSKSNPK